MRGVGLALAGAVAAAGYRLVVTGELTLDTKIGRRVRPLGPIVLAVAAPREVVFAVLAAPYGERVPRALAEKVSVVERGSDLVVAAHRTQVGRRLVTTTVESVHFQAPETVDFRLLRGPVPHVVERFTIEDDQGGCRLTYRGELGTDFWRAGEWWGDQVAKKWEAAVRSSLDAARTEAERRARRT